MSWMAIIMHLPEGAESFSDIPRDYNPPPLGTRDELVARFREHFGEADVIGEPGRVTVYGNVFHVGEEDVVTVMGIRNPSEGLLDFIVQHTDWKILSAEQGTRVRWLEEDEEEDDDSEIL